MNIGEAIKTFRENKYMKQGEFAKQVGISPSWLSLIENGKKAPSLGILKNIADYLEIPLPILFWQGVEEKDVKPDKVEFYKTIKPVMDSIIKTLWVTKDSQ